MPDAAPVTTNDHKVSGVVAEGGKGIAAATVTLFWQQIRTRVQLATGQSSANGDYELSYTPPAEHTGTVLVVVEAKTTTGAAPVDSRVVAIAPELKINLDFQPDGSEYTSLLLKATPLLGTLHIADLVESDQNKDISYLAQQSSQPVTQIMRLVTASLLEAANSIAAPVFYAFLSLNVPNALPPDLLAASDNFKGMGDLVTKVASLIFAIAADVQQETLERAIAKKLIAANFTAQIPAILQQFEAKRYASALTRPYGDGATSLGQLMSLSTLTGDKLTAFAQALLTNTEPMSIFWQTLSDGKHGFTAAEAASAEEVIELGSLVKNQIPMVKTLQARIQSGTTKTVADLAALTEKDWEAVVTQAGAGAVPTDIAASGTTTAAQVFAGQIYTAATEAYPTTALASRIDQGSIVPEAQRAPLTAFFAVNSELDLPATNLDAYLAQKGSAPFTGIAAADQPGVIANVRRFQRVMQVAANVDTAQALLGLGLDSSAKIVKLGERQFVAKATAAGVLSAEAESVYTNAEQRYAGALALVSQHHAGLRNVWPAALGDTSARNSAVGSAVKSNPMLEALFGSQDFCVVDPATSAISPAAYLTDILRWLSQRDPAAAYNTFRTRRPDIGKILLNQANTFTPVPYIDLVNELLEDAVAPPTAAVLKQTAPLATAEELRATPQYVNADAYAVLAKASFPHTLPYNRDLDELRATLRESGVALWQLRKALEPLHGPVPTATVASTAAEGLGIDAWELQLITTKNAVPLTTAWNTANPVKDLAVVSTFLLQAGITYEQLLELVATAWVGNGVASAVTAISDHCDITQETIAPLDEDRLDRMHRFLRLWRRTGWKIWEVDQVLNTTQVGAGALDAAGLAALFDFHQLLGATKLPLIEALAFFGDIDTLQHRNLDGSETVSLYSQLFENPAVPPDAALVLKTMNAANPPAKLTGHLASLSAALQVSAADAAVLAGLTDGNLTLANLSLMYRVVKLAQGAGLSIVDLVGLLQIESITLAQVFASPAAALAFVQTAKAIAKTGFTIPALTYVLSSTLPTTAGLTDAQLTTALTSVQAAIQAVQDAIFKNTNQPPLTVLQTELSQLPAFADPALLAATLAIVGGTTSDQSAKVTAEVETFMTPTAAAAALALPLQASPTDLPATQAEVGTRVKAILTPLAVSLTQVQVTTAVASGLQLSPDVATLLLGKLNVPGTTELMLAALTDTSLISSGATASTGPLAALRLLDKIGTLVRKLSLVAADVTWLLANTSVYGGLDLTQLPVLSTQPPIATGKLSQTVLAVNLNRAFVPRANSSAASLTTSTVPVQSLFDLIAAAGNGTLATAPALQASLAAITGWALADIAGLATAIGMGLTPANDYLNPATYERLRSLLAMADATRGTGAQLVAWAAPALDATAASSAQQALKSRYNNDAWLQVAPRMTNPIRERSNAALRAYLTTQRDAKGAPKWGATDQDLFDYFLIDVQMNSIEISTRIVQAYASLQLFVQRCLMNLEPGISLDTIAKDDGWNQWEWMQRFQLWVANRKIFLYPENWLIETQRPSSTELFDTLAQQVHQQENVSSNFEGVLLNYIDGLDGIAHLRVTGICVDEPKVHVVARTVSDPPTYYIRTLDDGIWTSWQKIPLSINAHQVTPQVYGGNLYLFWPQITTANEPQQMMPAAKGTDSPSVSPPPAQHVEITLGFSVLRNGSWSPVQLTKGKLYDMPVLDARTASHADAIESLYTLKTVVDGSWLYLDVFRLGGGIQFDASNNTSFAAWANALEEAQNGKYSSIFLDISAGTAVQVGRVTFDGRFEDLMQRNLAVLVGANYGYGPNYPKDRTVGIFPPFPSLDQMLYRAQTYYGTDAQSLIVLPSDKAVYLQGEPNLEPRAGVLTTAPRGWNDKATKTLTFTSLGAIEQNVGPLLGTASLPFRVVGPNDTYSFYPFEPFVYSDNARSYFVAPDIKSEKKKHIQIDYAFSRFYHPYTSLFWHELGSKGIDALYNPKLQTAPDSVEPGFSSPFSFSKVYAPAAGRTSFGDDSEVVDFSTGGAFSVYNWELFFHVPLYLANLLSQNQQFEDAMQWFHYIFNPTRAGSDPVPQRYWIPKPLSTLTSGQVEQQNITNILELVDDKNPAADKQVAAWRNNPYDPFLIADTRPVAYMKNVFMSYLDNLIAWADNLFSTDSREALNEATLLYVLASEILGPQPEPVTPPSTVEDSFDTLAPKLDAFADAFADIENVAPSKIAASHKAGKKPPLHAPEALYFKIPPNDKLLGYWDTIADRLFKLRHSENIEGVVLQLGLFDSPIDPGLLASGASLSSVLSDGVASPLPNYRFATCYAQAMDFCSAVRAYGASLQTALEKGDADQLSLLLATTQQQLLKDANGMYQMKIDAAQAAIDSKTQALQLATERQSYYSGLKFMNPAEITATSLTTGLAAFEAIYAALKGTAAATSAIPTINIGVSGFGGSPSATASIKPADIPKAAGDAVKSVTSVLDVFVKLSETMATYNRRQEGWEQSAAEAQFQIDQSQADIVGANIALQMAQLDQQNHQSAIDNLQEQIDLLKSRFSNQDLYDWMARQLSNTYFQSYRLAYSMAKRAERCYRYELGLLDSSFISYGYWDSLRKGLLSGESLNHDLRRMEASYLDLNVRRFEISRIISLGVIDPVALSTLLQTGSCDFQLPEALFDGDYPGHYQRRITRVSITVVYPNPGKNDNVKCTLTLVKNSVRLNNELGSGYAPVKGDMSTDPRFTSSFGAVQSIVTGNAQDDPGLFINSISANIADARYLPFEGAGCISSWHLQLPAETNDIDLTTVGDVLIHLYYTALDGGSQFKQAAQQSVPVPTSGVKIFSALNDFSAAPAAFAPAVAEGPVATPWQVLTSSINPSATPPLDQELSLSISASKFPNWTRGKTITFTSPLTVYVLSAEGGAFALASSFVPKPKPTDFTLTTLTPLNAVPGYPNIASATVALPAGSTAPGSWTFKLRTSTATDFQSLKGAQVGDILFLVNYTAS